ncbi:MAG: nuclear transport factor 2 family protein [Steroidobacteraceae bacterium]
MHSALHRALLPFMALYLALAGCHQVDSPANSAMQVIADRNAIEGVLAQANLAFEVSDADKFATAFADNAVFELKELYGSGPVYGFQRMRYESRAQIREIISDRLEAQRKADPNRKLTYDPASLRRFNRNSDSRIELLDATHAKHWSTWMVVMHTSENIHISAVGRYEDELEKRDGQWLITRRQRIE